MFPKMAHKHEEKNYFCNHACQHEHEYRVLCERGVFGRTHHQITSQGTNKKFRIKKLINMRYTKKPLVYQFI
jgi:hypothetical protein